MELEPGQPPQTGPPVTDVLSPDPNRRVSHVLTYPDCPEGADHYHLWTTVVHDDRAFQIVWFNHPGNERTDRKQFDAMLDSFEFDS